MTSSFDRTQETPARRAPFVPQEGASQSNHEGERFEIVEWFDSPGACDSPSRAAVARWPDATELAAEAFAAGRLRGRAELPWSEAERYERAAEALERALEELVALRTTYLMRERGALVELALAMAETLVRRRVEVDPESLVGLVEAAIESFEPGDELCLHVSGEDCEVLSDPGAGSPGARFEEYGLRIEADQTLSRGDVRVIAKDSEVDARLPSLLDRIREELAPLLASEESAS